jgi:hypothetical protein
VMMLNPTSAGTVVAAEPREQRFLAIPAAAGTVVAGKPHHGIRPFGQWLACGRSALVVAP